MSRQAAYDWAARYEEKGLRGLRDRPRSGRPRKVNGSLAQQLNKRMEDIAQETHRDVSEVTGAEVQELLRDEFGIDYSLSATYVLLRRLGLKGRP